MPNIEEVEFVSSSSRSPWLSWTCQISLMYQLTIINVMSEQPLLCGQYLTIYLCGTQILSLISVLFYLWDRFKSVCLWASTNIVMGAL